MRLDYVLALKIEDFLERRLQTQVFKSGLAKSIHHARVLIRQRHIRVGKQVVNVPSFVVRLDSQKVCLQLFSLFPLFSSQALTHLLSRYNSTLTYLLDIPHPAIFFPHLSRSQLSLLFKSPTRNSLKIAHRLLAHLSLRWSSSRTRQAQACCCRCQRWWRRCRGGGRRVNSEKRDFYFFHSCLFTPLTWLVLKLRLVFTKHPSSINEASCPKFKFGLT